MGGDFRLSHVKVQAIRDARAGRARVLLRARVCVARLPAAVGQVPRRLNGARRLGEADGQYPVNISLAPDASSGGRCMKPEISHLGFVGSVVGFVVFHRK